MRRRKDINNLPKHSPGSPGTDPLQIEANDENHLIGLTATWRYEDNPTPSLNARKNSG